MRMRIFQGKPHERTIFLVVVSAVFCLILTILMGVYSVRNLNRLSETFFNQRQLAQAQKIAAHIQEKVFDLELALLNMSEIVGSYQNNLGREKSLLVLFSQIRHFGVSEFQAFGKGGQIIYSLGLEETPPTQVEEVFIWAKNQKKDGSLLITQPFRLPFQTDFHQYILIASPTFRPSGEFNGACFLRVSADMLANRAVAGVGSKTGGYAWVIDQTGFFLAHQNSEWVGQEALQVQRDNHPGQSSRDVEEFIKNRLLQAEEGIAQYKAGWHPNHRDPSRKLVAFSPVRFFARPGIASDPSTYSPTFWSVAVVTPAREFSGLIQGAHLREWLMTGVLIFIILVAATVGVCSALRWNSSLQGEVNHVKKELWESQQNLLHTERLASIGKAASIMSHEIKNPLIVIGGYARKLAEKLKGDERIHEKLVLISNEVDRLEKMLGEVKDITRRVPPKFEIGKINDVVREVQELMEGELENQGLQLAMELSPEVEADPCLMDPDQIKQVLINLVKNSAEAMSDGGRIVIRTYREKEHHVVDVEDSGNGIPQEVLKEIFNPFFSTKQKGTGLGLPISLKILEDHCGDIRVSSEVGRGAIFKMRLPCTPMPNS